MDPIGSHKGLFNPFAGVGVVFDEFARADVSGGVYLPENGGSSIVTGGGPDFVNVDEVKNGFLIQDSFQVLDEVVVFVIVQAVVVNFGADKLGKVFGCWPLAFGCSAFCVLRFGIGGERSLLSL